jgi:class 3 adenylate cyclase/tetratricopeptide (TPR) repeat protein
VTTCSSCGGENPDGKRFCGDCGTPLQPTGVREIAEERKVVTALFCDLVGFTATSERADPEDVARMLEDYFRVVRARIEGHGGAVEKFIGDAVVGVFGVPASHEDDPERAVRAGLRIAEDAEDLRSVGGSPLRLRIGINTGEAIVRVGISPASGEHFVSGDAINTASRIQSAAPEMGVAVGLPTWEATQAVIEYTELEPASVKGKSSPVRLFHAVAPRARVGALGRTHDAPFIGREIDLAIIRGAFDKAHAASQVQFVTVVGEPGIGKSRLVSEFAAHVDGRPELVTWRQGRCLSYGEGITFWALGEVVKAHAGILESDSPATASAKLEQVLPGGDERPWFHQRLLPLLGIEASSTAQRDELFTAWRRFLEHIAEKHPTVVVFEDIHWADEAMLDFLEYLVDHSEEVRLLVVATARPELYDRRPGYAGGLRNTTPINLTSLSDSETARLVSALLGTAMVPAELQSPILERAGGNPLYAEEFVRLLKDRGLIEQRGRAWTLREGADVPFPDSVHALISARLDTLSPDVKSLLADAAVVGKVFWAGAVTEMGGRDPADVGEALRLLSRRELVRPTGRSSIQGESEYSFLHVLAKDVAYAQLPRASRSARHEAAAIWIESRAGERVEDLAEVLAHHYTSALELAQAAGETDRAATLRAPALSNLLLAGERALGLDATSALEHLERAMALAPEGDPERARVLAHYGEAAFQAARYTEAQEALQEAIALFRAAGEVGAAARAMATMWRVLQRLGDPRQWTLAAEAVTLVEPLGPSPDLVAALTEVAVTNAIAGKPEEAIGVADRALAMAAEMGLPRPARALGFRGIARARLGDPRGPQDVREAIQIAAAAGQGREVALLHNNLGIDIWPYQGPAASLQVIRDGIAFARPRGLDEALGILTTNQLDPLFEAGEHDEALAVCREWGPRLEESGNSLDLAEIRAAEVRIMALRGRAAEAVGALEWLEDVARGAQQPDILVTCLSASAEARGALAEYPVAAAHLSAIEAAAEAEAVAPYAAFLGAMVRVAVMAGDASLGERLADLLEPRSPHAEDARVAAEAILAEARNDLARAADAYREAAGRWGRFGVVPERAYALLGEARCLMQLSRGGEAIQPLHEAHQIFQRLEAAPALAQVEVLLRDTEPGARAGDS